MICKICNRSFNNLYGLVNHVIRGHKIELKYYYDKYLKNNYEEYCNNPLCFNAEHNRPNFVKFIGLNGYKSYCSKFCQYQHLSNRKDVNKLRSKKMKKQWDNNDSKLNSAERGNKISKSLKGKLFQEERKKNISLSHLGQKAWNKGLKIKDKNYLKNLKISHKRTINEWIQLYPTFAKIEEMRYNPDKPKEKEIQVHCKNHNCKNSKEKGGWFTPSYDQFFRRISAIEHIDGNDGVYFYCSDECKEECPIYGKPATYLIKQDMISAGHLEDPWYNSAEYLTWRAKVFELDNYICKFCGKPATVAHHINPQKIYPDQALDPENGIACCQECHFKYGHRDRWCTTGYLSALVCERIVRLQEK